MCNTSPAQVSSVTVNISLDHLPAVMTIADLAAALGRSPNTVASQVRAGLVPSPHKEHHGRPPRLKRLWHRDEIAAWLRRELEADMRATAIECESLSDTFAARLTATRRASV